jgi:hypothetical protein
MSQVFIIDKYALWTQNIKYIQPFIQWLRIPAALSLGAELLRLESDNSSSFFRG